MARSEAKDVLLEVLEAYRGKSYDELKPSLGRKTRTTVTRDGTRYQTSAVVEATGRVSPSLRVIAKLHGRGDEFEAWSLKATVGLMTSGRFLEPIRFETPGSFFGDLFVHNRNGLIQIGILLLGVLVLRFLFV